MLRLSVLPTFHFRCGAHECLHTHLALDGHGLLVRLKLASFASSFLLFQVLLTGHLGFLAISSSHGGLMREKKKGFLIELEVKTWKRELSEMIKAK